MGRGNEAVAGGLCDRDRQVRVLGVQGAERVQVHCTYGTWVRMWVGLDVSGRLRQMQKSRLSSMADVQLVDGQHGELCWHGGMDGFTLWLVALSIREHLGSW